MVDAMAANALGIIVSQKGGKMATVMIPCPCCGLLIFTWPNAVLHV